MPYLYCQHCRLTIHEPRMFAIAATTCPRCKGELDVQPARLFDRPRAKGRRFEQSRPTVPLISERPVNSPGRHSGAASS